MMVRTRDQVNGDNADMNSKHSVAFQNYTVSHKIFVEFLQ